MIELALWILAELGLWIARRRRRFRVAGDSMAPMFADGDLVLVASLPDGQAPPIGAVVVARHSFKNLDVIKFVEDVNVDGMVELRSPSGDDSRQFGRVPLSTVRGTVTANLTQRKKMP